MKKLLIFAALLVVLLVAAFFVGTSSGFLKTVVLPRVGAALNAQVSAESISLQPFSSIEIRNLSVVPNGAEPLAKVALARVRYRLADLLAGRIALQEVLLSEPIVTVIANADGSSNLDPILQKLAAGDTTPPPPAATPSSPDPLQLDLTSLSVENCRLSYRATAPDGSVTSANLDLASLRAQGLRNAATGRIEVQSTFAFEQSSTPPSSNPAPTRNAVSGTLKGALELGLSAHLAPTTLTGQISTGITQAAGAFADAQGVTAVLDSDLAPEQLRRFNLDFARQGSPLGSLAAQGPLDLSKQEGNLTVTVRAIDRHILNLAGAAYGLDFTTSRFDATNQVEIASAGQRLSLRGTVRGTALSVQSGDLTLPPMDLDNTYDLTVDLAAQSALIQSLALSGRQGGRQVLQGSLTEPMRISWSPTAGPTPDAAIDLAIQDLRLADWSALVGSPIEGQLNARAQFGVRNNGRDLVADLSATLQGLSGSLAGQSLQNLGARSTAQVLIAAFAEPAQRRLTLTASVEELSGAAALLTFDRHALAAQADIGLPEGAVVLHDVQLRIRHQNNDGGTARVQGRWDLNAGAGELTFAANNWNEHGLRPFLQTSLGDKQLRSGQLAGNGTFKLNPAGDLNLQATTTLTNLVVHDPSGTVPPAPLSAGLALDLAGTNDRYTFRQGQLQLSPTDRARNQLNLTGFLDLARTNALDGELLLAAESIDVTPFFNLFYDAPTPPATTPPPASPTPTPASGPMTEPEPIEFPINRLALAATIGQFFLREVAAEQVEAKAVLTRSGFELDPFSLSLNGAPIRATTKLNLGVPGYQYDLRFSADAIPVRPLANSFVPLLLNRIEGNMVANAEIRGAGVTGINLRKNLTGQAGLSVTNANLSLTQGNQQKGVLTVLTRLLASALRIPELHDRPIMDILAQTRFGEGRIDITQAMARSTSLQAGLAGQIPIADDLFQSPLDIPVQLSLSRDLAQRANLMSANTPTNAVYVVIPTIASLKGTLGEPKPEVDKVQAGLLVARGVAGLVGSQTGGTVGGIADLVGTAAQGGTNVVGNLLQGLGGLLAPKTTGTNTIPTNPAVTPAAPATNAPAPTTNTNTPANAVGNLLRGLLDRRGQ